MPKTANDTRLRRKVRIRSSLLTTSKKPSWAASSSSVAGARSLVLSRTVARIL